MKLSGLLSLYLFIDVFLPSFEFALPCISFGSKNLLKTLSISSSNTKRASPTATTLTVGDKSLIPSPSTSITYKTYPEDFVVIEDRSLYAFLGVDEEKDNSNKHNACTDANSSLQFQARSVLKNMLKVNEMEQLENL